MRGYLVIGLGLLLGLTAAWAGDGAATALAPPTGSGPSTQPAADAPGIQRLIEQLGDPKVAERNSAQQALVKIGLPAVEALTAAAKDANLERAGRARDTLAKMALRKEDWPVSWRGMTCSFCLTTPAESMTLVIDGDRRATLVVLNPAGEDLVRSETTFSREGVASLFRALGGLRPWELNAGFDWPPIEGGGTLELTGRTAGRCTRIVAPWQAGAPRTSDTGRQVGRLMSVRDAVMRLSESMKRDVAIRAKRAKANWSAPARISAATTDAASAKAAELVAEARRLGKPVPVGELFGTERGVAIDAYTAADQAKADYEKAYGAVGKKSPAGKADPNTPAAREAFAKVERMYLGAIEKLGVNDYGDSARWGLAGAYRYHGQRDRFVTLNREAGELKLVVARLKELAQLRREATDWPELVPLVRLLRNPGNVSPDEIAGALAKLGARRDEVVGRLTERFWDPGNLTYRWRVITALGVLNTQASRNALLDLALEGGHKDDRGQIRGAAREYIKWLTNKRGAMPLLAAKDTNVLQQAVVHLRGEAIDKAMFARLLTLMKSPDRHLRSMVVCNFGQDPGRQFASEKVAAIVQAIPDIATMDGADKVSGMMAGSSTNAEFHYRMYIGALAKSADGGKVLDDALSRAQAGAPTWRCLVLARAFGGDAKSRPEVRKILSDAEAGIFRAWSAEALGKIGTADDLPLLREVAEKDPMRRERGGCLAPMNKQLHYPVREAAQQAIKTLQEGLGTAGLGIGVSP